jgi:hypothetical protein
MSNNSINSLLYNASIVKRKCAKNPHIWMNKEERKIATNENERKQELRDSSLGRAVGKEGNLIKIKV